MKSVRLPVFVTAAALCAALTLGAFARMGFAAEGLWRTDFKAAVAKAKEEKKYLLVDFTGSDWCGWCIKLHNEVFDKEPFKAEAPKQFVLVELDFPQSKKMSDELKKQNKELSEKYKVEGFPTVLVMDAEGQVIARTGYREGGPEKYLKQLAEFPKIYQDVLACKGKLEKAQGLDRAKLLDQIIDGYEKLGNESEETTAWAKEIISMDPDNKAGLKVKYEFPLILTEAGNLMQTGKTAEAKKLVDKALALKGVSAEKRQQGYILKFQVSLAEKKFADAVAALKLAKEAAPETGVAKQLDGAIEHFAPVAEAQEAADKLEAELAKTEGIERAKLLDKLVDATQKLVEFDPEAGAKAQKWIKEIIALDADGKADLKKKYEVKAALAGAEALMRLDKSDEANVALDRALEAAGSSGEDVQKAQFFKAQIARKQGNSEQAVAHLKKALEAAPQGKLVPMIQMLLRQAERAKKPAPAAKKPAE